MNSNNMNIFDAYKGRVSDNDLVRGLTKTRAIDLSTLQVPGTISPATIQALYESLSCEGWSGQRGATGFGVMPHPNIRMATLTKCRWRGRWQRMT